MKLTASHSTAVARRRQARRLDWLGSMSDLRFEYVAVPDWPMSAWLAQCRTGDDVVTVFHGSNVERAPEWFWNVRVGANSPSLWPTMFSLM